MTTPPNESYGYFSDYPKTLKRWFRGWKSEIKGVKLGNLSFCVCVFMLEYMNIYLFI